MQQLLSYIRHQQDWIFKFILILSSILLLVYILPNESKFKYEFQKGKPWLHDNLIAPFDFAIYKDKEQYNKEIDIVKANKKLYFQFDESVKKTKLHDFNQIFNLAWDTTSLNPANNKNPLTRKKTDHPKTEEARTKYALRGEQILTKIYNRGVIEIHDVIEGKDETDEVLLVKNNIAEDRSIKSFFTLQEAYDELNDQLAKWSKKEAAFYNKLFENLIIHNVLYDPLLTEKALTQALENISETYDAIQKGERIVGNGDLISEEIYLKLNSLKLEYEKKLGGSNNFYFIVAGQFLLITLLIGLLLTFLVLFRKDVIDENAKVAFILFLITSVVFLSTISLKVDQINIYVIPFCILPVLMRAFYDVRLAIFTHIVTALIIGFVAPNSFEFSVIQIIGGIAATYSVISIQKRSQIFITSLVIFIAYSLTYLSFSSIQEGNLGEIEWSMLGWFGISAMLTIIAFPLMYLFEKAFSFLSDVTLLELSDTNHPLLREMAERAPGTFQHSIQVANLAEDAARQTDGHPLLVRVGALYHDIGKMKNPAFFIENQSGVNPHDELEYLQSSKIIINHVIDGIELAKKHRLPEEIIDFIRTHHGTSTTGYFYKMYQQEHPDEEVDKSRFSYPGPTPFSKETAILMMADACEAASRSIKKPTEQSIKSLVEAIIESQMKENQFINADITFKEIDLIKKIFVKKLLNIYHVRIEYPK